MKGKSILNRFLTAGSLTLLRRKPKEEDKFEQFFSKKQKKCLHKGRENIKNALKKTGDIMSLDLGIGIDLITISGENSQDESAADIVKELEEGTRFPKDEYLEKYAAKSGVEKEDLVVHFKGAKKTIKSSNENWYIFFSGIISSIPISLLLSFTNFANGLPTYFWYMFCAFVASLVSTVSSFIFTINLIAAKDKIKGIKQEIFYTRSKEYSIDQELHNLADYEADKWLTEDSTEERSSTKFSKTLNVSWLSFLISLIVTLVFLVICWGYIVSAKG